MKTLTMLVLFSALSACSSPMPTTPAGDAAEQWRITATPRTDNDQRGRPCGTAHGLVTRSANGMKGEVHVERHGYSMEVAALIEEDGSIVGGFARGGNNLAAFEGQLIGSGASGEWRDSAGCSGEWQAVPV